MNEEERRWVWKQFRPLLLYGWNAMVLVGLGLVYAIDRRDPFGIVLLSAAILWDAFVLLRLKSSLLK